MMIIGEQKQQDGAAGGLSARDISERDFETAVLAASMQKPVIVDFWAPWCQPCRTLGPLLEKEVAAANGAVVMVKIDTDRNQQLAAALQIQSIPTVYAFFQGRPVDGFMGVKSAAEIKAFVGKLAKLAAAGALPDPAAEQIDAFLTEAEAALADDPRAAMAAFNQIVQMDKTNLRAQAGLVRGLLALGETDAARQALQSLSADQRQDARFAPLIETLTLVDQIPADIDGEALQGRLETNPKDHAAAHDLALLYFAASAHEEAIGLLLDIIAADRKWNDDQARKTLIRVFDALGPAHPLTLSGRRRLSTVLFS